MEMGAQQRTFQDKGNMQDRIEQVKLKLEYLSRRSIPNLKYFCRIFGVEYDEIWSWYYDEQG